MDRKKIVLVTGASSGIGKATVKQLLSEGHIVYAAARKVEGMPDNRDEGFHALKMDVTKDAEIEKGVSEVIEEQGRIDVLVNNAGFGLYGSVEETSLDDARYQFDVNVFGVGRLTQLVLPHMRKQKSGTIVNISSMGGKMYTPLGAWYHATKHAIEGWSDCLRIEVKQFGIKVIIIEPGLIQTKFGDVLMEPMLKTSGSGPYKRLAQSVATATKSSYAEGAPSPPIKVAKTISKAISKKNPRTRYAVGKMAGQAIFIRKYLGDKVFDKIIMKQVE